MSRSNVLTRQVLQLREMFEALDKSEQDLFLDLVDPQPEQQAKPKAKRVRKAGTKSPRATKLGETIKSNLQQRAPSEPICSTCGNTEGYVDHSQPSPSYHPFETGKAVSASGD